jgi:flavin-dependent dehydrogenase
VEAAAIMGVMNRNPNKPANELLQQINGWPLLPRKIFPASLTPVKDALSHTLAATSATAASTTASSGNAAATILGLAAAGDLAAAQAAAAAAPFAITAAPPGLSKELEKTLDDIEAAAAGRAGPAVQDAPTKPKTGPIKPNEKLSKVPKGLGGSVLQPPAKKQQQREQQQQQGRREKELADRKAYLKNFWYAAGKGWWWRLRYLAYVCRCVRRSACGSLWQLESWIIAVVHQHRLIAALFSLVLTSPVLVIC